MSGSKLSLAKFRRMETENSSEHNPVSTQISSIKGQIQPNDSDMLSALMRRADALREVLTRKLKEAGGITPAELSRQTKGDVSPTAIKEILRGNTKNPGMFTVVDIAEKGLGLSALAFIAEVLGDKTDDPNFKAGQFATLAELYKGMTSAQRQKADVFIGGLLLQFRHIKNQK